MNPKLKRLPRRDYVYKKSSRFHAQKQIFIISAYFNAIICLCFVICLYSNESFLYICMRHLLHCNNNAGVMLRHTIALNWWKNEVVVMDGKDVFMLSCLFVSMRAVALTVLLNGLIPDRCFSFFVIAMLLIWDIVLEHGDWQYTSLSINYLVYL